MDVFEAFPNAITTLYIAPMEFGTIAGNKLGKKEEIHVIMDEGSNADNDPSPSNAEIFSDTLIYCKPYELPTLDPSTLVADYAVLDAQNRVYAIEDAGVGRNQHTGRIEHLELKIRPTGATEDESE